MKFASCFAALAAASECGPKVVTDGHFPSAHFPKVEYADHFDIIYPPASNFKVLNNFVAKHQYVLTMCESEPPSAETVEKEAPIEDSASKYSGFTRKYFTVPLKSYGSDSTATLAFLDIIDVHDRQMYISQYATAPCLQKAMSCNSSMVAASAYGDDDAKALRLKQISHTDGFFVDGAGDSPNAIGVHAYLDPHMLNRAEWIKFVGAFFNREDAAEQHMKAEETKWEALKVEAAAKSATPLVAFIDNAGWAGQYKISLAPYKTLLVAAAGGKSFTPEDFSSNTHAVVEGNTISFDAADDAAVGAFHTALADADVLIDETYAFDPTSYNAASFADGFGFDGAGAKVFRLDGLLGANNGLDWFEGAFARPATVLADFVAAMHGTDDERTYLRELDSSPTVMTHGQCDLKLAACEDDGVAGPALIEAPCERYKVCVAPSTLEKETDSTSACAAAALLLAAATFA